MSHKIGRWLNKKEGKGALLGLLTLVVVVAIFGQWAGWWVMLGDLISGTATMPTPTYPMPTGGYTCLPSCVENDAQFLSMPGEDMATFGGESIVVWISVPGDYETFELSIFDGDSGKDGSGNNNVLGGNWDNTTTETTYTLYNDPLRDGQGTQDVDSWLGNSVNELSGNGWTASSQTMLNNGWYTINVDVSDAARGPSGHYFYRLEATRPMQGKGINAFKLRSTGYLSTGQADLIDANFAIVGMLANSNDVRAIHPQRQGNDLGPSTYTGEWQFYLYVPEEEGTLELWDGDFDFGSWECDPTNLDSRLCNTIDLDVTQTKPDWASDSAVEQGFHARGIPADDNQSGFNRRQPNVTYQITDPFGDPFYTNDKPSGSEEWKRFVISTDPRMPAHHHTDKLGPGFYTWHIQGLDMHNTVWIRTNYSIVPVCQDGPCDPPPVCDATCPRTIGYWRNNVAKTLEGKTIGVQETPESIEAALRLIALQSPLFRHGINVANPLPLPIDAGPLTLEEADIILQRKKNNYPDSVNTMLARALQQNLATWLNWGTGKVCDFTQLQLAVAGGTFQGRLEEALAEAQEIMLINDLARMERAKDIGDKINNGNLGENANIEVCADTTQQIPPDKQPPKYDKMPKAPKPDVPDTVVIEPQPDPETCQGVRTNTYGVEITNSPFYGIKFEYKSGTEIKDGNFDEFAVVLTQAQVQALTSVQMEAKAGTNVEFGSVAALDTCDFASPMPCGGEPVQDETRSFAFYFMGAEDNGNGTFTLRFQVQNMTANGLSHVTIGLPEGAQPPTSGSYESKVCP